MELWNTLDLAMPPINTYKSSRKDVDIKHLYKVCQDLKHFFMNEYMHAEHLVLSRIIYRMKQKFRSSKDFKSLEKVNKSLENFFRIRFVFDLNTFLELIPSRYKDKTYLPTKNLLDYVLVRLQGLVKLMERVVETCKISAFLLDVRMKLGHFWKNAVICFALVSRVYILAKYNANRICEFYGKLLPFSSQLENSGKNWLPKGYLLPKDLKIWMNAEWLEFDDEVQITELPIEVPDIIEFFDLVDDDDNDVEFCEEYVMIDDIQKVKNSKNLEKITSGINEESLKEFRGFSLDEDIGEVIEFNDKEEEPEPQNVINISDYVCLSDSSLELVDLNRREMGTNNDIIVVSEQSLEKKLSINKKGPAVKTKKLNEKNRISKNKKTKKMKNPLDKNKTYVQNECIVSNEQKSNVEVKKRKVLVDFKTRRMNTNIDVIVVSENVPLEKKFSINKKGATVRINEKDGTRKKKKTKKIKYPMNKINTINENLVVTDQQKRNVQVDKRKLLVNTDTRRVETNDDIIVVSESGPLEKKLSINKKRPIMKTKYINKEDGTKKKKKSKKIKYPMNEMKINSQNDHTKNVEIRKRKIYEISKFDEKYKKIKLEFSLSSPNNKNLLQTSREAQGQRLTKNQKNRLRKKKFKLGNKKAHAISPREVIK